MHIFFYYTILDNQRMWNLNNHPLWIKNAQNNNLNLKEFEVLNGEKLTKTRRSEMNFISWHLVYVDMRDMMVIKLFLVKIWLLWY